MHRPISATVVVVVLAVTGLTACGSNGPHAVAPTTTVTLAGGAGAGTTPSPAASSPRRSSSPGRAASATGKHDHVGESCSGRTEGRYAAEHMVCIVGRLQKQSRGASASATKRGRHNRY